MKSLPKYFRRFPEHHLVSIVFQQCGEGGLEQILDSDLDVNSGFVCNILLKNLFYLHFYFSSTRSASASHKIVTRTIDNVGKAIRYSS